MDREGQYLATSASLILVGSLIIPPRDLNPRVPPVGLEPTMCRRIASSQTAMEERLEERPAGR